MAGELIQLIGGGAAGFLFKYFAEQRKAQQEALLLAIRRGQFADGSADRAARRVPLDVGKLTRRVIVFSVVFGLILGPAIFGAMGWNIVVERVEHYGGWLFGLLPQWSETVYENVSGFLILPEVRATLPVLVGFYFGQGAAK